MTDPRPTDSDTASSEPAHSTPYGDRAVGSARRSALNEDWAATIVGLLLLALVLTGVLPGWLVP